MPWGEPKRVILSDADRRILHDVKQSCGELMAKLTELDAYIETLNTEVDLRRHEHGGADEQPTPTTPA